MRLELALVVGILLFCSWCAYIVARISSSVNVGESRPAAGTAPQPASEMQLTRAEQQLINQTGQTAIIIDHPFMERLQQHHQAYQNGANVGLQQPQLQQPDPHRPHSPETNPVYQPARQYDASEPVPARHSAHFRWQPQTSSPQPQAQQAVSPSPAYFNQQQQQQQQPQQLQQSVYGLPAPANNLNQWQAYTTLPSSSALPAPSTMAYEPGEVAAVDANEADEEADDAESEAPGAGGDAGEDEAASDGESVPTDAGQQMSASEDVDDGRLQAPYEESPEDYEEFGGGGDAADPSNPQSELEEISNRRSYNELESDSRERDKDGNLVVTSRRHLINGKPVAQQQQQQQQQQSQPRRKRQRRRRQQPQRPQKEAPREVTSREHNEARRGRKPARGDTDLNRNPPERAPAVSGDAKVDDSDNDDGYEEAPAGGPTASERDFEQMVHEIDQEDKLRQAAASGSGEPSSGSLMSPTSIDQSTSASEAGAASPDQSSQRERVSAGASPNATTRNSMMERREDSAVANLHADVRSKPQRNQKPRQRHQTSQAGATLANNSTTTTTAASTRARRGPANSHEHRLQETLTAQQWDDDSASQPDGGQEAAAKEKELRDEEDQERVDNIVGRDAEARQLERLSRNLLRESTRVPEELERRKRQTAPAQLDVSGGNGTSAEESGLGNAGAGAAIINDGDDGGGNGDDDEDDDDYDDNANHKDSAGPNWASKPFDPPPADDPPPPPLEPDDELAGNRTTPGRLSLVDAGLSSTARHVQDGLQAAADTDRQISAPSPAGDKSIAQARANWKIMSEQQQAGRAAVDDETRQRAQVASVISPTTAADGSPSLSPSSLPPPLQRPNATLVSDLARADSMLSNTGISNLTDTVRSAEDMHVAVLASPPAGTPGGNYAPVSAPLPPTGVQAVYSPTGLVAPVGYPPSGGGIAHFASGSHKVAKRKKSKKKKRLSKSKRSKMVDSRYKAAKAFADKQKRRTKKGNMKKKKRKSYKDMSARRKHFEGLARGKKLGHGHKYQGAKKGSAFLKNKGYKKKGFKRSYHKLETGDHKTYFDEFRDKDHNKKWKDFNDKHKYSQKKKWAGYDSKHMNRHKLDLTKGNAWKKGAWKERSALKHAKALKKYKKSKKKGSMEMHMAKKKKKKKSKKKKMALAGYGHH